MTWTTGELVGLVGIVVTGLVALVGWRRALASQVKIQELEQASEQRRYDRGRLTQQLAVFDELLTVCSKLVAHFGSIFNNPSGETALTPREAQVLLDESTVELRVATDRAIETARLVDSSSRMETRVVVVYEATLIKIATFSDDREECWMRI